MLLAVEFILWIILIAASFGLPALAARLGGQRTTPVPPTDELTDAERRTLRQRFVMQPAFWVIALTAIGVATQVTIVVYLVQPVSGLFLIATMIGVPYVLAVSAILYLTPPIWHRVVTDELKRRGKLRACPACGYDRRGSASHVCPECGGALGA